MGIFNDYNPLIKNKLKKGCKSHSLYACHWRCPERLREQNQCNERNNMGGNIFNRITGILIVNSPTQWTRIG